MKNDTSIALSYPQNRTARRVGSYERHGVGIRIGHTRLVHIRLRGWTGVWAEAPPTNAMACAPVGAAIFSRMIPFGCCTKQPRNRSYVPLRILNPPVLRCTTPGRNRAATCDARRIHQTKEVWRYASELRSEERRV